MSFIYSYESGNYDSTLKRYETPIKMLIESESDIQRQKKGALTQLFNIERSDRYGEKIDIRSDFSTFSAAFEGEEAETDTTLENYTKIIEHIPFMKEFVITKQMIDDSANGLAVDAKRRAQAFVRAYYLTMNKLAEAALIGATEDEITFNRALVNTSSPDGRPLFATDHFAGNAAKIRFRQSNYFGANRYDGGHKRLTIEAVSDAIMKGASKIRNMKDENGEVLGYNADTVIIPGNLPMLEKYVKQVLCSPIDPSGEKNNINILYGGWNVVVLPSWQYELAETEEEQVYPMMIMSSEANRNLCGNMFFNRVPLSIKNHEDIHTRNWVWNGYCRFGIGFGSYKHIALIELYSSETDGTQTQL